MLINKYFFLILDADKTKNFESPTEKFLKF